jgi:hypothetical protein
MHLEDDGMNMKLVGTEKSQFHIRFVRCKLEDDWRSRL